MKVFEMVVFYGSEIGIGIAAVGFTVAAVRERSLRLAVLAAAFVFALVPLLGFLFPSSIDLVESGETRMLPFHYVRGVSMLMSFTLAAFAALLFVRQSSKKKPNQAPQTTPVSAPR